MIDISVIIPVYNVEKYLRRCIDSILNQSFTNYELILIDDGSRDSSGDICDEYSKKYKQIKVFHQENKGQAAARNKGILNALGEWIVFVDADDMIQCQMLEYLYRAVTSTHTLIASCKAIEGEICPEDFNLEQKYECTVVCADEKRLLQWCSNSNIDIADKYIYWIVWGKLIHKSLLEKFPFKEGRIYEDNAIVFRWLFEAGKIACCDNIMYFYFMNKNGTTKGSYSIRKLDWLWALEEQFRFYKKINYYKMVDAIGIRFMREAVCEYDNIEKYLKDKKSLKKIRGKLLRFWFRERKRISISREEILDIFTHIYPRQMQLLWHIKKKIMN